MKVSSGQVVFGFFLLFYLFGLFFYKILGLGFIDEALSYSLGAFFFIILFNRRKKLINISFIYYLIISIFFLLYSFHIRINDYRAIIGDFIVQNKPFVAFFAVLLINSKFSKLQKDILKKITVALAIIMFFLAISGNLSNVIGHVSRVASTATILAFVFLFCSEWNKKTKIYFIIILSLGLFSGRAKFFGLYGFVLFSIFFVDNYIKKGFKISFREKLLLIIQVLIVFVLVVFIAKNKIEFYFVNGMGDNDYSYARPILYLKSIDVFRSYFPFGSGYGTYGSYYSGIYYSKVYYEFGIDKIYGLWPSLEPNFISDTYFPMLIGQFGIIGIVGVFMFFRHYVNMARKYVIKSKVNKHYFYLIILIIIFFIIESVADSTIIQNRGVFVMMLLAQIISELKIEYNKEIVN